MKTFSKIGAISFILWGIMHMGGGSMILLSLSESPNKGFAYYQHYEGSFPELAGSVLGYMSFIIVWLGILVAGIGIRYNWRNYELGLALNTFLVFLTEIGLIIFLVLPGYVSWAEAFPGLLLFLMGSIFGGIACQARDSFTRLPSPRRPSAI